MDKLSIRTDNDTDNTDNTDNDTDNTDNCTLHT